MDIMGGESYFPLPTGAEETLHSFEDTARVRYFNDLLSWDGIQYVADTLHHAVESFRAGDDSAIATLVPSLAASLCLVPPSVPILSTRFALQLMPHLSRCISRLEHLRDDRQAITSIVAAGLKEGKWIIRATGSSSGAGDFEEYVVDFTSINGGSGSAIGFEGTGVGTTGKSKNGLVAIFGTLKGSSLHFVEEWSDGCEEALNSSIRDDSSSCVVAARLNLNGMKFEGAYRNVHFGTSGNIVGIRQEESGATSGFRLKEAPDTSKESAVPSALALVTAQTVLCLAHSHLANILGEDAADDIVRQSKLPTSSESASASDVTVKHDNLKRLFSGLLLSTASLDASASALAQDVEYLKKLYCAPNTSTELRGIENALLLDEVLRVETFAADTMSVSSSVESEIENHVASVDDRYSHVFGGVGSLKLLSPSEYCSSRRRMIRVFLCYCGMADKIAAVASIDGSDSALVEELEPVWRYSLQIMEDGVRSAVSKSQHRSKRQAASDLCLLYDRISGFLLGLDRPFHSNLSVEEASGELALFYVAIESDNDIQYLNDEMACATKRGLMRLIAMHEAVALLRKVDNSVAIESLVAGFPRLLGRGQSDVAANLQKYSVGQNHTMVPYLGGNYFAGLSGSSAMVQEALRSSVRSMFRRIGQIAESAVSRRNLKENIESFVSLDSLVLSLLTVFVGNIRMEDLDAAISESGILTILPRVVSAHRSAILEGLVKVKQDEEFFIVKTLETICQRDLSRAMLRCSTALAHVILYQAATRASLGPVEAKTASQCLGMLLGELAVTFPFLEHSFASTMVTAVSKQGEGDWGKWYQSYHPKAKWNPSGQNNVGSAGIQYLQENGITLNVVAQSPPQKQPSRQKSSASTQQRSSSDKSTKGKADFSHNYLSHWLHALCAVFRPLGSVSLIKADSRWLVIMLKVVGLSVVYGDNRSIKSVDLRSSDVGILPARFRARILRLVQPLLASMEPCQAIIEGLFSLAGVASPVVTRSADEEESLLSREAVSLLRHLHSPARPFWRDAVNRAIKTCAAEDVQHEDWCFGVLFWQS